MLILSRRVGESIKISDNIEVVVLSIDKNQVRIGINAPRNIDIDRHEIAKRKTLEKSRNQTKGIKN